MKHILFTYFLFLFSIISNAQSWNITGNSGTNPPTNFLGTKDNKALVFKTNNAEAMRILANGKIGIGITNPLQKLHVHGNINIDSGFALYMANHKVLRVDSMLGNIFLGNGISVSNTGDLNTISGYQAFHSNTTGSSNAVAGDYALFNNTSGSYNVANGAFALYSNSLGYFNVANGNQALYSNNTGSYNIANGYEALFSNSTGYYNVANGYGALFQNIDGNENIAAGLFALYSNTTGRWNIAAGSNALYSNTNAQHNNATGDYALYGNTTGSFNTADGSSALYNNSTGQVNTAAGYSAIYDNTTGNYNAAFGSYALNQNTDSWYNAALGYAAGASPHGWNNTFVGSLTDAASSDIYNATALGNNVIVSAANQVRIGNDFVNSIGGFSNWTNISDGRVKKNIKENVPGLAFINKLKPITYNLDLDAADKIVQRSSIKDKDGKTLEQKISQSEIDARNAKQQIVYTGFVAQDVEKAAKELNYDFSGVDAAKNDKDLYGLRYSDFVVPLVKAVQELSQQNDELKQRIEKLESMMSVSNQQSVNISSASLEQNIPNPLTKSTSIGYTIPAGVKAQIIVLDNSGKTIKQIVLNQSGKGVINVDASTLSAGAYTYTLVVNEKTIDTKKMLIAR
jgi:hypothetical protein